MRTTSTPRPRSVRVAVMVAGVVAAVAVGVAGCGGDDDDAMVITLTHPPTLAPEYIDLGAPGPSVGDQRIFRFDATDADGGLVRTNWIMTTTAVDDPEAAVETRIATGVFTWGDLTDSLILEGEGWYPGDGAVLKPQTTLERSVIGGTGRFAGATGRVVSTRFEDGSWQHEFRVRSMEG
jgi:hypothetical protein